MRVIFLQPNYPPEMQEYTRGLAEVGVEVFGIGDSHPESLSPGVKRALSGYLHVPRIMDEVDVVKRATEWMRGKNVDRVLANWEPLVILAAKIREAWGIPGMSVDVVTGFRDKQLMKERVRAAGVRTPMSQRARSKEEVWEAREKIGYPMIVKPISGAGSADTYRVDSDLELQKVLALTMHVVEVSCEEYIEGEEFTYDTVCVDGKPLYENCTQYMPKPLEARTNEWISPVVVTIRDMNQKHVKQGVELGRQVLKALKMGDGFTHMEWFYTKKGEAVFGEIGCRPGGAHIVDQMNYTSDIDLFREWARAACWRTFEADTTRKYNVGIVFKRAKGQGRIQQIVGLREFMQKNGRWVVEEHLSRPGMMRRNWKQTLLSDGHLLVRHPDWDEAKRMSFEAATGITLYAE